MRTLRLVHVLTQYSALLITEDDDVLHLRRIQPDVNDYNSHTTVKLRVLCEQKIKSFANYLDRIAALSEDGRL